MESGCNRITSALAFVVLVPALWSAVPERGWLDRGYPVAKLDGKRIFLSGFPKDDGEIDMSVAVTKKKAFYSIVEFCFYDHATGRAFGYGIDAVETKYHGMLSEVFSGGKVDAGGHMEKMARSLTDLLLRSDASLVKKYAETELAPPAKASVVKEEIREILDTEEE